MSCFLTLLSFNCTRGQRSDKNGSVQHPFTPTEDSGKEGRVSSLATASPFHGENSSLLPAVAVGSGAIPGLSGALPLLRIWFKILSRIYKVPSALTLAHVSSLTFHHPCPPPLQSPRPPGPTPSASGPFDISFPNSGIPLLPSCAQLISNYPWARPKIIYWKKFSLTCKSKSAPLPHPGPKKGCSVRNLRPGLNCLTPKECPPLISCETLGRTCRPPCLCFLISKVRLAIASIAEYYED